MVRRATAGNPGSTVDPAEVEAAAPSYTVHTLERLRRELGDAAACPAGRGRRLCRARRSAPLARPVRPGSYRRLAPARLFRSKQPACRTNWRPEFADRRLVDASALRAAPAGGIVTFAMTQLAISATQIRKLLANDLSACYLLPDDVLDYIQTHSLPKSLMDIRSCKIVVNAPEDIKGDIEVINTTVDLAVRTAWSSRPAIQPPVKALARNVQDSRVREAGAEIVSVEGRGCRQWVLVDTSALASSSMSAAAFGPCPTSRRAAAVTPTQRRKQQAEQAAAE